MKPLHCRTPPRAQHGIVLVLVLWLLALLALMAAGYSTTTRTESQMAATHLQAARARGLAEAGVWLGVQQLLQTEDANGSTSRGLTQFPFGAGVIDVHLQDEAGKIDLNTAHPELLLGLLQSAGADTVQATALRDAILDWRDRDNLRRAAGAEDAEYRAAGRDDGAKNGPFNSIEELRAVMGMTEPLFQKMRPALTLYSHQPGVAGAVAVESAVAAVPGSTPDAVRTFMDQRVVKGAGPVRTPMPAGLESRYLRGRTSQTFAITSTGTVAGTRVIVEAVVQLRGSSAPPFAVLSWREAPWQGNSDPDSAIGADNG